jgi:hypothetical protein
LVTKLLASKPAQWAGVALAALSSVPLVGHWMAPEAAAQCDPIRDDDGIAYRVGWSRQSSSPIPVSSRANIQIKDVYAAPNHSSGSAIALFQGYQLRAVVGWQEVNFGFGGESERVTFAQFINSGGNAVADGFHAPNPGESPKYTVNYVRATQVTPGHISFYQNLFPILEGVPGFIPDQVRQYSEITTLAGQMPGEPLSKEYYTNADIKFEGQQEYQAFVGNTFNSSAYWFGLSKVSGSELNVWDWC